MTFFPGDVTILKAYEMDVIYPTQGKTPDTLHKTGYLPITINRNSLMLVLFVAKDAAPIDDTAIKMLVLCEGKLGWIWSQRITSIQ